MIRRQKIKAIVIKHEKTRKKISLFGKKKENYKSDTIDKIYSD